MSFLSPYFLIGLAAVGVPLLIHLLTRDRVRREAFSTLRFFAKVSRKVLRRKRFREMLLLAMRAAVCGLLVLAFARPYLRGREADELGATKADTARVVLVDVSASMARQGMAAAAAREAAEALASLSSATDAAALITFSDVPRVEVPLSARFDEIRSKLRSLAPGQGGTDIAEAVRKADALLRGAAARKKEIVLVSDLQRAGWRNFKGDWKLAADTRLTVRPVAPPARSDNLAIVEADYPASTAMDGLPRAVAVRVANYSVQERRDVEVALSIAGRKVDTQKVHIRPGESVPVRFRHVFAAAGDNPGAVTVAGADAAPDDNLYYFNTRVIPRIRVAVVSGPPAGPVVMIPGAAAQDAGFFIEKALAPAPESPFVVKRVPTARARPEDFADVQVAIVADVKELPPAVVKALGDLLSRGGGLLFLPGQQVQADTFGQVFGALAPCKLRSVIRPGGRTGDTPGAVLTKVDFEHPVFEVFQHPHYGDLSIPRFRQFWEVGDSQLAHVLARFDGGKPAVLEREIGGGLSMMLASPVDLRWNNLPLRAVFLPYLHQTVRYLAVRSERRTGYLVGETLPVPEGRKVTDPKGEPLSAGSAVAVTPGFYAVSGSGPADAFQFAVNRDPAEADPATVAPEEITAAVLGAEAAIAEAGEAAGALSSDRDRDDQGLWWYVLAGVVVLTVAELFVANRTMRH
jgi:hypothetical protein